MNEVRGWRGRRPHFEREADAMAGAARGLRPARPNAVITMLGGARVDLLAPDWREIDLDVMAFGLARQMRFLAQSASPMTIAGHSRHVAALTPARYRLAALLHDGHEYALGDVVTPLVVALDWLCPGAHNALASLKWLHDLEIARAVLQRFAPVGVPARGLEHESVTLAAEMRCEAVRRADAEAFVIEDALRRAPIASDHPFFGETDPSAQAATWLGAVRKATAARFAGGAE